MIKYILLLILILPVIYGNGQTILTDSKREKIAEIVSRDVPENSPGVAFGIVHKGKIIYTQYEGLANLDNGVPIDENSRFNIASNGKQFTALAVLRLIDDGLLGLEDDIRKFFPDFCPAIKDSIRVKHLITHTSGIRDVYDLLSLKNITWWEQTYSNTDVIKIIQEQRSLNFKPGSQYLYSNSNYILLAELVSRLTRQPFGTYMEALFRELGMPDTRFEPDHTSIKEPVARPYFNFDTWQSYEWVWNAVGDGNLFSTLKDQLDYEVLLQTRDSNVLSKDLINLSQQPIIDSIDYGYGVEFGEFGGRPVIFHHGSTGAWKATVLRFPNERLSLITLSNSGKTLVVDQNELIAQVLLDLNASENNSFLTAPAGEGNLVEDDEITGFYKDGYGTIFQFEKREDGIYLIRTGRNDVKLSRVNGNTFEQLYDPAFKQEFVRDMDGALEVTVYYTTHAPYTLKKIEVDFSRFDPSLIAGDYTNPENNVTVNIRHRADNKFDVTIGEYQTIGKMLTPATMLVDFYMLSFQVDGLLLDGNRIKNLFFTKSAE